jgi:hypothetical protein
MMAINVPSPARRRERVRSPEASYSAAFARIGA